MEHVLNAVRPGVVIQLLCEFVVGADGKTVSSALLYLKDSGISLIAASRIGIEQIECRVLGKRPKRCAKALVIQTVAIYQRIRMNSVGIRGTIPDVEIASALIVSPGGDYQRKR